MITVGLSNVSGRSSVKLRLATDDHDVGIGQEGHLRADSEPLKSLGSTEQGVRA